MKTLEITVDRETANWDRGLLPRDLKWDRLIPENRFERQLLSNYIAHQIWENQRYERDDFIFMTIEDAKSGSIAQLSLHGATWDEHGRLQGKVSVFYLRPSASPVENLKALWNAKKFPIFFFVVSMPTVPENRECLVMVELPPTPFNSVTQCVVGGYELPRLALPPSHLAYEKQGHLNRRRIWRWEVPTPNQENFALNEVNDSQDNRWEGDSTEGWLNSMGPDERAQTVNNLDWDD